MTDDEPPERGCQLTTRMDRCGDEVNHVVIVDTEPLFEDRESALDGKLWICDEHVEDIDESQDAVTVEPVD